MRLNERSSVLLPQPDGPISAVMPVPVHVERHALDRDAPEVRDPTRRWTSNTTSFVARVVPLGALAAPDVCSVTVGIAMAPACSALGSAADTSTFPGGSRNSQASRLDPASPSPVRGHRRYRA